jgi:DNA-binding XRE family transcriptional regulator
MPRLYSDLPSSSVLLTRARDLLTQQDLADRLDVNRRTIARWETGETECPANVAPALREIIHAAARNPETSGSFTLIDLFAGIGDMRAGGVPAVRPLRPQSPEKPRRFSARKPFGSDLHRQ